MDQETHGSIPYPTTYRALEALYAGWRIEDPGQVFDEGGLDALDAHHAALSDRFGYEIRTPEALINIMGYRLLGQDRAEDAITVFQQNADRYTASVNVYDSLGDGYDAAERYEEARWGERPAIPTLPSTAPIWNGSSRR